MKRFCTLLIALISANMIYAQAPTFQWAKSMGGPFADYGISVTTDASGNVYTTGDFQGTADFDPGPTVATLTSVGAYDTYVSKMDPAGNLVWVRQLGGTSDEYVMNITVDAANNVYTIGLFAGTCDFDPGAGIANLTSAGSWDIFISKLDAVGNFVWAKHFGGVADDYGQCISVDPSGNLLVIGNFIGTADFDPGPGSSTLTTVGSYDTFVSKLDAAGNLLWVKQFAGAAYQQGWYLETDASGNVFTSGQYQGTVDFNPGAGVVNLTAVGNGDVFVTKLDASGNYVWAKSMGGIGDDRTWGLALDGSNNVYTTGFFSNTVDFDPGIGTANLTSMGATDVFISKLDAGGNYVYCRRIGGTSDEHGNAIAVDASGKVFTTGYFYGTSDFDPGAGIYNLTSMGTFDVFVSKFDASGNFAWAQQLGGVADEEAHGIALDLSGNVYTTGYYFTTDFNGGPANYTLTSTGDRDVFVHKLADCGLLSQPSAISGANSVCAGSIQTYSITNNPSATSYTWSLPVGWVGSSTTNSVTVMVGLSGGMLTVTANDACGSSSPQTLNVSVNSLPTVIANVTADTICSGNSVIFTGTGATSYAWTGGVTNAVPFTPASTNTYTVTGTDANGCSNTANTTVTLNTLPTVAANVTSNTICAGNSVTFTGGGATSYTWTGGVTDGNPYTPVMTDTYTVAGTDANGCMNSASVMVILYGAPVVTLSLPLDTICQNMGTVALSGETPAGGTWSGPGVSGNFIDPMVSGTGVIAITYMYTDSNSCSSSAIDSVVVDICNGVVNNGGMSIGLDAYPNPTSGVVNLVFTEVIANELMLEVTDLQGQIVYTESVTAPGTSFTKQIDLSSLASGTYFVKVNGGSDTSYLKIVKQD